MMKMMRVLLPMPLLTLLVLSLASCSHFRGGSLSWKPTSNSSQIEISHQIAWRRSYSTGSYCDDTTIASQGTIRVSANFYCRVSCNGFISSLYGKCIAYNAQEDWSLGEESFLFNVPTPGVEYTFRLEGCCWQEINNGVSFDDMKMTMTADLRPRGDTGVINSSPVVTMTPIVRLLAGCQHSFRIPVIDADGDTVRCRFPTPNNYNECGYLCNGLPGSTIETNTCIFSYNATSGTGTYGVSIQIEDFAASDLSTVLSSVPLQFLIIVYSDSLSCDDGPTFVEPTPPEASCHVVDSTFTKVLVARTKSVSHTITKIFVMGPTGMKKSGLASYGSSGREWSIAVTWSPMQNQGGYHLLCFSAEINNKLSSKMICIDVLAGTPPSISLQPNCLTPIGDIVSGPNITFKMCFDKKFIRPATNKYLIIYHSNGTEVKRLNFNDLDVATFSTVDDLMVIVTWGNTSGPDLLEYGQYFILIGVGSVAAPPLSCVSDWPGINQPWYWNFTVVDRTPPSLDFLSIPRQVNDNEAFSMSWNVSESLSFERCNLTNPTTSSIVNCHDSLNLGVVIAGNYSISIEIEDLHGNKAGPYEHHWVVTDVTPPSLTFVRNNSLTRSNVSITWTVSEPVVSSNCTVTFPNGTLVYETCNDKWEAIDLPPGSYQISIVLVDSVGFIGEFQHKWTNIDVTPPILIFKRKPNRSQSKVNITWDTNEETNGLCQVEGPSSFYRSVVCDKAWSDDYLSEGEFILNVTVYDLSLNMAGPFQHKWYNSDIKPPELKMTISPLCDKSYDNATIMWSYNEYATSTCRIKTSLKSESVPCDKSWSGTFMPEGNVTIEVDARDSSGNSAPTFKYTWYNEDTTPPVLTFTKKEVRTINDAVITWSINEPASTDCTLTTPFTTSVFSCESGSWSESSLQGGSYELSIRLLDLGNNSAGPYLHKWQNVDTIRPSFTFSKLPTRTYSNATIEWHVSEPVNGSCEIVGPSNFLKNVSCDGGWVGVNLPPGTFTFQLLVTDTSGNIGDPFRHTWINEDVTPPSLYWKGAPPSLTHGSIVLSWTTDEAVPSLCTVHSPIKETEVPCNNEWVGTELRHGEYSLTVLMVDGSGNKAQTEHHWNNTVLELVFELIMTLSNVRATNFFNKTSPEYSKFEAESQLALEKFYHSNIDNFKEIHIRKINVLSKSSSPEISTVSPGSDVEFDYDVVLVGNDLSTGSASLSKSLSKLSSGESSITIGGSTASFSNVILLSDKRTSNVTFSRQTKPCEIAQFYVTCSLKEYCNEYTAMCVTNKRPDNNGLILSIGLGVIGLVVLVLVTATIGLFRSREKEEQYKRQQATKKRFETPLAAVTSLSQMMYNPYRY